MFSRTRLLSTACCGAIAALSCGTAFAQSETAPAPVPAPGQSPPAETTAAEPIRGGLEEIVVTARRRAESIQSVPETVVAVTGDKLVSTGARGLAALSQQVPGLTIAQVGGAQPVLSMRGDSNRLGSTEPGTGVFIDGVYQNRYTQLGHGPVDVERVEVAKGPQSTLYGRNTIAGAISIVTQDPTDTFQGAVEAGVGGSSTHGDTLWHAQGMLSGPLIGDTLLGRIVVQHQYRNGFIYDATTGIHALGYDATTIRGKLLWHANPDLDVKLTLSYFRDNAPRGEILQFDTASNIPLINTALVRPFTFSSTPWQGQYETQPFSHSKAFSAALQINWTTSIGKLESISSFQKSSVSQLTDLDATRYSIATQNFYDKDRAFQQDFRLTGSGSGFTYLVGLYYLHDKNGPFYAYQNFGPDSASAAIGLAHQYQAFNTGGEGYAAYGQLGYDFTDAFNLTGGLRYAYDHRVAPFSLYSVRTDGTIAPGGIIDLQRSANFNSVTGDITASYKIERDVMLYAKYSRGDKAGGFGSANNATVAAIPYLPQKVDAYEIGLKSEFLDRRVRLNVSGYYNKYSDLQLVRSIANPANPGATINVISNAASATAKGVDVDLEVVLTPTLRLTTRYAYIDAKISSFALAAGANPATSLEGLPIPRSPKNSGTVGLTYTNEVGPGRLSVGIEVFHSDKFITDYAFSAPQNRVRLGPQKGYELVNLTAGYDLGDWGISAYLKNAFNKGYFVTTSLATGTAYALATPGEPRTFEVTLRRKF